MKKGLMIGFFILVLLSANVFALNESLGGLAGLNGTPDVGAAASEVQSKTNEVLAKEIQIPEKYQKIVRLVFGIKPNQPVDVQTTIFLICLIAIVLILVSSFAASTSGEQKLENWLMAVVITFIGSASGILLKAADFIKDLGRFFGWIQTWSILSLALSLILIAAAFYGLSKLIKSFKNRKRIDDAEKIGEGLGTAAIIGERTAEYKNLGKGI